MRIWLFLLVPSFAATPLVAQSPSSPIGHAAWLAGCWEMRVGDRLTMEMWMPPDGGTMMGASRTTRAGVVREYEQLRLHTDGDTLIYSALPSGQRLADFKSTSISESSLVFENPTHDFPKKITYRRIGADSIVARVEGPGPDNTSRGFDFPMKRASCTQASAP